MPQKTDQKANIAAQLHFRGNATNSRVIQFRLIQITPALVHFESVTELPAPLRGGALLIPVAQSHGVTLWAQTAALLAFTDAA